jgi:hypothetical protein
MHLIGKDMEYNESIENYLEHKCPICGASFALMLTLCKHKKEHEPPPIIYTDKFECNMCGSEFDNEYDYAKHMDEYRDMEFNSDDDYRDYD